MNGDGRTRPVVSLIASAALALLYCVGASAADVWSPGHRAPEWERIDVMQRYPLFDAEVEPDWRAMCDDESPLVRAAAALSIGRIADATLVPLVAPLLKDEWPFTRQCALWALLRMETPLVKEPLLSAVGSWPSLELPPGTEGGALLNELPPLNLAWARPLPYRREWVKIVNAAAWEVGPAGGGPRIMPCLDASQWDSGDAVHFRVHVSRAEDFFFAAANSSQSAWVDRQTAPM